MDLDGEIELFRRAHGGVVEAAVPPQPQPQPQQHQPPPQPPQPLQQQKAPPPRPAWGSKVPQTKKLPQAATRGAAPEQESSRQQVRAPDALGLGRLQHACSKLELAVATYEQSRSSGPHGAPPPAEGAAEGAAAPSLQALLGSGAGGGTPSSFSACNAKIVQMVTRLVAHLHRSDAELNDAQRLRAALEAELEASRAALSTQAAAHESEVAALRRDFVEIKTQHGTELQQLTSRLASLESVRAATPEPAAAPPAFRTRAGSRTARLPYPSHTHTTTPAPPTRSPHAPHTLPHRAGAQGGRDALRIGRAAVAPLCGRPRHQRRAAIRGVRPLME